MRVFIYFKLRDGKEGRPSVWGGWRRRRREKGGKDGATLWNGLFGDSFDRSRRRKSKTNTKKILFPFLFPQRKRRSTQFVEQLIHYTTPTTRWNYSMDGFFFSPRFWRRFILEDIPPNKIDEFLHWDPEKKKKVIRTSDDYIVKILPLRFFFVSIRSRHAANRNGSTFCRPFYF